MANSILASLFSKPSLTIVDEDTRLVRWPGLKVSSVEINASANVSDMPLSANRIAAESGTYSELQRPDYKSGKILMPSRMRIIAFVDNQSVGASLIEVFLDVTHTLSITSKSIIANKMAMTSLQFEQKPEMTSAVKVTIEFEQVEPAGDSKYQPAQSADESATGFRIQSPPSLLESVNSLYNRLSQLL